MNKKLSKNEASKKYLDEKYGKSKLISKSLEEKLVDVNESANKKIEENNHVYSTSANRSHLYPVENNDSRKNTL